MKINIQTRKSRIPSKQESVRRIPSRVMKGQKKLRFKSLLVPIDFSETSSKALDYAVELAQEFGSQIRLLHVLEPPAIFNSPPSFANWDDQANEAAKMRLAALADDKINEFISVNAEVRIGRAYRVVCETARKERSDLIVIGTHGFTGLKHLFLGSTAERVIRHSPCAVLVVRRPTEPKTKPVLKPKNILVPTDFSKPATQALNTALALAKQYEAKIHLLNVVPVHYAVGEYDFRDYAMLATEQKEVGQKRLATISKKLIAKKFSVDTNLAYGRPAFEINETAAKLDCDLIVISTHGHTGWEHVLLGSTTEEVVRHAICPVLVVKNL